MQDRYYGAGKADHQASRTGSAGAGGEPVQRKAIRDQRRKYKVFRGQGSGHTGRGRIIGGGAGFTGSHASPGEGAVCAVCRALSQAG